jgi:NAD(P)-dependent dehydrogenase (short-subunit alcohol dehydrogenase family)
MSVSGKVVIITGAAVGIGLAAGHAFAKAGARVVLVDVDADGVVAAGKEVSASGAEVLIQPTDITDPQAVNAMVAATIEQFGRVDALYNNAGGPSPSDGDITQLDVAAFESAFRVDLFGTIFCSRAVIGPMRKVGGGAIVNTTSMVAVRGVAGRDAYVAAKGAIISLTKSMAAEFGRDGITVNAIAPGVTRSERVIRLLETDGRTRALTDRHVVGFVEPSDVAAAAVFLAGDGARRITAQVISVDSGSTQVVATQR